VVLGFPDVAEVVALGDGDDHGQYSCLLSHRDRAAAGLTMIISMNATVCGDITMVSDWWFMIICSDQGRKVREARKSRLIRKNN